MKNENELNAFEEVQKANELLKAHAEKEWFSLDVSHLSPEKKCELVLRVIWIHLEETYMAYIKGNPRDIKILEEGVKFICEFLEQFRGKGNE